MNRSLNLGERIPRRSENVVWVEDEFGRVVLTRIDTFDVIVLTGAGSWIWVMCDGARDADTVVRDALGNLHEAPDDAGVLCEAFLEDLVRRGLLCV